jgi:hypothetical protein
MRLLYMIKDYYVFLCTINDYYVLLFVIKDYYVLLFMIKDKKKFGHFLSRDKWKRKNLKMYLLTLSPVLFLLLTVKK